MIRSEGSFRFSELYIIFGFVIHESFIRIAILYHSLYKSTKINLVNGIKKLSKIFSKTLVQGYKWNLFITWFDEISWNFFYGEQVHLFCFDRDHLNKRNEIRAGLETIHFTLDLLGKSIWLFKNQRLATMSLLHILMYNIYIYILYNIYTDFIYIVTRSGIQSNKPF